ncbi:MAG: glycosyltransferase family 39 protein [Phycisphaerae bacterium]|nr:glycosyltransferase family 39 protein [Phycisphaerae bacterium]
MKPADIALLALAVLVGLVIRLYFFTGLIASDDLTYAESAHRMFQGADERTHVNEGTVVVRRLGVNFPLFLATRAFGVHERSLALVPLVFSLGGIVAAYATLRLLAGPGAGLLAAWLWACLPADVYTATVWLPDNIFATVCMVMTYFLAASEAWPRRQWLAALLAGIALGYLEYVKEAAYILLLPWLAWGAYTLWRTRRVDLRPVYVLSGFLLVQVLASVYFWTQGGHPLVFWQHTIKRYSEVMLHTPQPLPFPANIAMGGTYVFKQWILGYGFVLFPLLLIAALMDRRLRLRGRLLLLLALQMYIVVEGWKLGSWTQRYILHATASIVALSALGLHALTSRLPPRRQGWSMATTSIALIMASIAALRPQWQQHGRFRADVLRSAHAYLQNNAGPEDVIYADLTRKMTYAPRALALLAGFQPFKGGFQNIDRAYRAQSGWVLLTHLDDTHRSRRPARSFRGIAPHWLEVCRAEDLDGNCFARVFKILPAEPPPFVAVLAPATLTEVPIDLSQLEFESLTLAGPPEALRSRRWVPDATTVEITLDKNSVRCLTRPDPGGSETRHAGIQFSVVGLAALRGDLTLTNAHDVQVVFVYLYGGEPGSVARYQWRLRARDRTDDRHEPMLIVPGLATGGFRLAGGIAPEDVREVHVFVRVAPGAAAGFTLRNLEIATPELVDNAESRD